MLKKCSPTKTEIEGDALKSELLEFATSSSSTVDQVINLKSLAEGTEKENLQNTPKYFAFSNLVT